MEVGNHYLSWERWIFEVVRHALEAATRELSVSRRWQYADAADRIELRREISRCAGIAQTLQSSGESVEPPPSHSNRLKETSEKLSVFNLMLIRYALNQDTGIIFLREVHGFEVCFRSSGSNAGSLVVKVVMKTARKGVANASEEKPAPLGDSI